MTGTNHAKNLEKRFPTLLQVVGKNHTEATFQDLVLTSEVWFHQVERDLKYLAKFLDFQALSYAYKDQLLDKNQFGQTVYEIYTAALLASASDEIQLHVPTKGGKNCDFRVKIRGREIYGEVKTRDDKLPFNTSPQKDDSGEYIYAASRATVDPHVADGAAPPELDMPIPETTELRQRIEQASEQLPDTYPNLVVLGLIGEYGFPQKARLELEGTLLGDEFFRLTGSQVIQTRHSNGIFCDQRYGQQITAVAWLCLKPSRHGVNRRSGIFFNQNAEHHLPKEARRVLEQVLDREKSLNEELKRIVEKLKSDYQPEKIILFGSLAQGDVKEGSDIDLAIIKKTNKRPLDRCLEVAAVAQPSVAVNFLVYTPEEFQKQTEAGNFFVVDEIIKRGEVLYER